MSSIFDKEIEAASKQYGVEIPLIKAVIQTESSFNPKAYRAEPKIKDASYGLMQLLQKTAIWVAGKPITPEELYLPATNIMLGTKYLSMLLKRYGGNLKDTISAYNMGTAKKDVNGNYLNSSYVNKVWLRYEAYRNIIPIIIIGAVFSIGIFLLVSSGERA